ncbi:O-antigen polysaccharide polymerase Wzy [Variovorax ureilyticus]|uniref:O-antigen polysaccharide polymerase Wzy n=1 Tax=Variovorax ureilyticus TaxID=1836198 RepID=A0ABU8VNV9_9BURK
MSAVLSSAPPRAASKPQSLSRAGQLFLAVFFIVVYEGAVRKWVTSASSLPLIGLRDFCAAWLIFYAWKRGYLRQQMKITSALFAWSLLVFGWGLLQLAAGQSSPLIFIIGLRFWLLYTWFAVAAAASMNETDYRAALLMAGWMMVLMAPLAVLQHYSPPGAWINVQLEGGDDEEGIFTVVVGVVRTTGTFSFTSGYATFMGLVAPIVFGLLSARKPRSKHYLFATAVFIAFLVGALVSGSRTAVISSGMMFMAYLIGRLVFSRMPQKPAAAVGVVIALLLVGIFAIFFRDAIDVTQTRFEQASEAEDFWGRVQTILVGESHVFETVNWLGGGVGYGSNLANFVRTGSSGYFALAESEGGRILLEGGLLGMTYVGLKLLVIVIGLFKSFRLSMKTHSPYPVLVWLTAALAILSWPSSGQLTANGLLGIILAFALLLFRFPRLEIFPGRASKT